VVSEEVLRIPCGTQKGGFERHRHSRKHNNRSNKSKSKKNLGQKRRLI
jgi:hypothetical protein